MSGPWTDELVEQLKVGYANGLSMSRIAVELGHDITRNAVIGKVHRLGLSSSCTARPRRPVAEGASKQRKPSAQKQPRRFFPAAQGIRVSAVHVRETVLPLVMPETDYVGVLAINILVGNACKWPVGDPTSSDFRFCGCKAVGSYCAHHSRLAYQPSKDSRRRDAAFDGGGRFADEAPAVVAL